MNKFIVKPNKTIEEITRLNKKSKEWLIDESFADLQSKNEIFEEMKTRVPILQRRNATFEEMQGWLPLNKQN